MSGIETPLPTTKEEAIYWAGFAYGGVDHNWDTGADTLEDVERPAAALIELLDWPNEINRQRLITELAADQQDDEAAVVISEKLDETLRFLDEVRLAARRAHRHRRREEGRPQSKHDLRAAYAVLLGYWRRTHDEFTNVWASAAGQLSPTSAAASFLYDSVRKIDPGRARLAEELRDLMAETVKSTPGPRQGRRT